jgi:hypothetical protein
MSTARHNTWEIALVHTRWKVPGVRAQISISAGISRLYPLCRAVSRACDARSIAFCWSR